MKNWVPFTEKDYDQIWNKIYRDFKFKPSISKFPSFKVPKPYITYDISNYYAEPVDYDAYEELEEKAVEVFKKCTSVDEYILALDWQHECYWVNPHLVFERDEFAEWIIPIFPDGDYYFFIQADFKWGFLGHPWERSITIFGEELIKAFELHKPKMFRVMIRQG